MIPARDVSYVLRLASCTMWGISGALAVGTHPLIGLLSILSAALFFIATVIERKY